MDDHNLALILMCEGGDVEICADDFYAMMLENRMILTTIGMKEKI